MKLTVSGLQYLAMMDEARSIWAALQTRDWVNPDLDFDVVMERLASNWDPWSLLARDRDAPIRSASAQIRVARGSRPDEELIERLRELAREPYEATTRPEPPNVGLGRLAADYERTTGRQVEFSWAWEADPNGVYWSVEVSVAGVVVGGCGEELSGDPESDLVALTDRLQSEQLGEEFDGDWPKCPHHSNIVMLPKASAEGIASWTCQVDPGHRVRIGNLGLDPF